MGATIKQHNVKILKLETQNTEYGCNCGAKADCLLEGACLTPSLVYKGTVKTENEPTMHYIGITEIISNPDTEIINYPSTTRNMQQSLPFHHTFGTSRKITSNSLSSGLLSNAQRPTKMDQNNAYYMPRGKEVYFECGKKSLLNKRSELQAKCRHANKFMAANYKPP